MESQISGPAESDALHGPVAAGSTGKLVLIAFGGGVFNYSVTFLSAYLRDRSHQVKIIQWYPEDPEAAKREYQDAAFAPISDTQLSEIAGHCEGADVVGVSILTTHMAEKARTIIDYLKSRFDFPVILGGIPVIAEPDLYLQYSDLICTGEGEIALDELIRQTVAGGPLDSVRGIAYRPPDGSIKRTPSIPLVDVNEMPLPLLDYDNHYVLSKTAVPLRDDNPLDSYHGYSIFAMRGCPFSCTFCVNEKLNKLKHGQRLVRQLTPDYIIDELTQAMKQMPKVRVVRFDDDDFFARNDTEFKELCEKYVHHIGIPVQFQATMKLTTQGKIDIMRESKLPVDFIKIGLQTGSERVNREIYGRNVTNSGFLETFRKLTSNGFRVHADIISDNPFEIFDDKVEALKFYIDLSEMLWGVGNHRKYFDYMDHKLMFYPGTALYTRAVRENKIPRDYIDEVLLKRRTARTLRDLDLDKLLIGLLKLSLRSKRFLPLMKLMHRYPFLIRFIDQRPVKALIYTFFKAKQKTHQWLTPSRPVAESGEDEGVVVASHVN